MTPPTILDNPTVFTLHSGCPPAAVKSMSFGVAWSNSFDLIIGGSTTPFTTEPLKVTFSSIEFPTCKVSSTFESITITNYVDTK